MKLIWGGIASAGLFLCVAGLLQLTDLMRDVFGHKPYVDAPGTIGIGLCVYGFARTWMLITWRRPRRFAAHKPAEKVIPQAH